MPNYEYSIGSSAPADTLLTSIGSVLAVGAPFNCSAADVDFRTLLSPGDLVQVVDLVLSAPDQWRVVATVPADYYFTVTEAFVSDVNVGEVHLISGLKNVEDLPEPALQTEPSTAPRPPFQPYAEGFDVANGLRRGLGAASAMWHWDAISAVQRNALRAYCPEVSALVYIRTRSTLDGEYHNYQADMVWPTNEEWNARGVRTNFEILFRNLIPV